MLTSATSATDQSSLVISALLVKETDDLNILVKNVWRVKIERSGKVVRWSKAKHAPGGRTLSSCGICPVFPLLAVLWRALFQFINVGEGAA